MAQNTFICPFCGGLAKMIKIERRCITLAYKIVCDSCGTKSFSYNSRDELVRDWFRLAKDCNEVIDVMRGMRNTMGVEEDK